MEGLVLFSKDLIVPQKLRTNIITWRIDKCRLRWSWWINNLNGMEAAEHHGRSFVCSLRAWCSICVIWKADVGCTMHNVQCTIQLFGLHEYITALLKCNSCYLKCLKYSKYSSVTNMLLDLGFPSFNTLIHNQKIGFHLSLSNIW